MSSLSKISSTSVKLGHLEALRRLQSVFEGELASAGIGGEEVAKSLAKINAAIGFAEDSVRGELQNLFFEAH